MTEDKKNVDQTTGQGQPESKPFGEQVGEEMEAVVKDVVGEAKKIATKENVDKAKVAGTEAAKKAYNKADSLAAKVAAKLKGLFSKKGN